MKRSQKRQWVADLRSGKFRQAQRYLGTELSPTTDGVREIGMCCLGVLVTGAARECINTTGDYLVADDLPETSMTGAVAILYDTGAIGRHDIPEALLPVVGLTKKQQDRLIHMNDTESKSFAEIADWIVKNIPSEDDNA